MKFRSFPILFLFIFYSLSETVTAETKPLVLTSNANLLALVSEIAGSNFQVESLAPEGADIHSHQLRPTQLRDLKSADLLILQGMDYEKQWLDPMLKKTSFPKENIMDLSEAISVKIKNNPHYLLDPIALMEASFSLKRHLSQRWPKYQKDLDKNQNQFVSNLKTHLRRWEVALKKSSISQVITAHGSADYFFKRFKINVIDHIEKTEGVQPSLGHIQNIIDQVKKGTVVVIWDSTHTPPSSLERIQQQTKKTVLKIPTEIDTQHEIKTPIQLLDQLVKALANHRRVSFKAGQISLCLIKHAIQSPLRLYVHIE